MSAPNGGAPVPSALVVVAPDVGAVVAGGFAPKRLPALEAGAVVLDDAAGALVVPVENKEGVVVGAEAGAGAVVEAVVEGVDAGAENNDGLVDADEVAVVEPPRPGNMDDAEDAVVAAAVLAGAAVVEAGFVPPKRLLLLALLSAGLDAGAPPPNRLLLLLLLSAGLEAVAPKRDGVEVPLVEGAAKGLGLSVAPVEAGFAPKRPGVPELLGAGWDAGAEAGPPPKRLELACGVVPDAPPPKRPLAWEPWAPDGWPKRFGVALAESVGGAPAGVVDPRPPNIGGFVGVACPAEAVGNKELFVFALVDGVELAAGVPPPKRPEPPPKGLAAAVEPAPAAAVGVLDPPPNTLGEEVAGLFSPEKRELPPPPGGVPVDAAPPNSEPEEGGGLAVELPPPNNEEAAGFEAPPPPKRPPAGAAGCPAAPALSFCVLPKEKPVVGVEDWLPNSEPAAGVDEDGAPEVA